MSRQYNADLLADPPLADQSAVTATSETALWLTSRFTPVAAYDAKPGRIYKVTAGGIMSFASTGTLTITPRWGLTTAGTTMGASVTAVTTPGATTNQPWWLEFTAVIRTVGAPGNNSTIMGTGRFITNATGTAGTAAVVPFGGTSATSDVSVATGITIGWTLTVAGSCTTQFAFIQSMN